MRYSVITKSIESDYDEPFLFENDAVLHFSNLVDAYTPPPEHHDKISFFLVDNLTNRIITSYDFFVSCSPVEYQEIKEVTTSTTQMINNLHDLMELKGITLTSISIKTGLPVSNLCRFFKADSNPTLKTYCSVSNAINLL